MFAFLGKSIGFVGWEVWYQLDQKRIALEKCENRDKPAMKYNGKCYLAKKLKKLEESENGKSESKHSNPFSYKTEFQINLYQAKFTFALSTFHDTTEHLVYPEYQPYLLKGTSTDTFHPPCFS